MPSIDKPDTIESLPDALLEIIQKMNDETIGIMANRIKEIGKLSATDVQKLRNSLRFANIDLPQIQQEIADLTKKSLEEMETIFYKSAEEDIVMADTMYQYRGVEQLPLAKNLVMQRTVKAAIKEAKEMFLNISKTTAFVIDGKPTILSVTYNKAVDKAIYEAKTGIVDYNTAMRKTVRDLARSGLRTVDFESGYSRRLDSHVRMNVLDGMRSMGRDIRKQQADEFGADGVYIQPHGLSSPDHLPHQGKEYTYKEFEALNDRLKRPIGTGELNCKHIAYDVIMGVTKPQYTTQELKDINKYSNEKVDWKGKKITRYEASQEQRKMETDIRRLKDQQKALLRSGDDIGARDIQKKINVKTKQYKSLSEGVGLTPKLKRTQVDGYRKISVR